MHDLSVIVAQNEHAARQASIEAITRTGKVALVQEIVGVLGIGEVREFSTAHEAKQAALGLPGAWKLVT
jgi:hypothetical protein